jgi:membrane protease YdiL (CAAX protease family)
MSLPRRAVVAWPLDATPAVVVGLGLVALALRQVGPLSPVIPVLVGVAALSVPLEMLPTTSDLPAQLGWRRWVPWGAVAMVGLGAVTLVALGAPVPSMAAGSLAVLGSVAAAVGEEAFFRRLLYGVLLRWGAPLAVAISAVAFAAIHIPAYGLTAALINLGAGILFGWQRWASGGWSAPAVTHAAANLLALGWGP